MHLGQIYLARLSNNNFDTGRNHQVTIMCSLESSIHLFVQFITNISQVSHLESPVAVLVVKAKHSTVKPRQTVTLVQT